MPKQPENWPAGCLPRMLDIRQASYYVGLSPAAFTSRVNAGRYPQGQKDGARVLWDRKALDAILDLRSGLNENYAQELADVAERGELLAALER